MSGPPFEDPAFIGIFNGVTTSNELIKGDRCEIRKGRRAEKKAECLELLTRFDQTVTKNNGAVIPAKAGIQKIPGFRTKPGMTTDLDSAAAICC